MSGKTLEEKQKAERIRWIEEPITWARKFGGKDFDPWSGQERFWIEYGKLLNAKIKRWKRLPLSSEEQAYARKIGISIMAGQGVGKGATISLCGLHYQFVLAKVRPKAVCTAPAGPQLHSSLWPEFGAWMVRNPLLGEIFEKNAKRIFLREDADRGNVSRIEPRTVQPNADPEAQKVVLAGVHAIGVQYLIDEASGIPPAVFEPIEGGLTDPLSMVILIFNPTRRDGFAMETHRENRDMWIPLHWDGEDLAKEKLENPGRFAWFNEELQVGLAKKFGKDSDFYRVRVKGLPPNQSGDSLIHFESAMAATTRLIETLPHDPLVVAADIGGPARGGDPSELAVLRGPKLVELTEYTMKDTTQLADAIADTLGNQLSSVGSEVQHAVGVDIIGIGRGVKDQLVNTHRLRCRGIDVSEKPLNERRFHRLRDQIYWELREGFMDFMEISLAMEKNGFPYVDDELIGELTMIKWAEVDGKIKVQGKGESSGIPHVPPLSKSPNKADVLAMAWYLYKHCCSKLPPGAQAQRRKQRQQNNAAMLGFRSLLVRRGT